MPSIDQLKDTLENGNDSVDNVMILQTDGKFFLVQGSGASAIQGIDYVTSWETFNGGNGYVTKAAANDIEFIDGIMRWAKTAWSKYEETGRIKILNPNM